jgi:two-component system sensor histidine kinase KdpD
MKMSSKPVTEWTWSITTVTICTGMAEVLSPYFATIDQAMLYFIGIVIVATRTGTWPTFTSVVLSIAAFDFFFVPPRFTFAVNDARYVVTFAVMFFVSFAISRLTNQIRRQADESRLREQQTAALYEMSRELLRERDPGSLEAIAAKHIGKAFDVSVLFVFPDRQGRLIFPSSGSILKMEQEAAQWALTNRQPAGAAILNGPDADATYVPLISSRGVSGVVGLRWHSPKYHIEAKEMRFLEAFASQVAIAIERDELVSEANQAQRKVETERLRNTLLSSISHDLRTPLTAVSGAVSALLENEESIDTLNRRELLQTIHEETSRLIGMLRNVLDLTRLESGAIAVHKEWQSLEEIIGVVLHRMNERLRGRKIDVRLPHDLPMIPFDALLIEQVLTNLFENVIKYTPATSPVELSATVDPIHLTVELSDRGPGITPGDEERIFEKFVRGQASGGGVGLGLAICRSIIIAHGGRIWAENRPGGGAVFRFTLPAAGIPTLPEREQEAGA